LKRNCQSITKCEVGNWCRKKEGVYLNIWLDDVWLYELKWWEMHEGITMKVLERVEKNVDWLVNENGQINS
jgi:hypothetical protein